MVSDRVDKKAFELTARIIEGIRDRFGVILDLGRPVYSGISQKDWDRFIRIWNLRGLKL